jgi:hypothetical protein
MATTPVTVVHLHRNHGSDSWTIPAEPPMQVDYGADKVKPLRHRIRRHLLQVLRVSSSTVRHENATSTSTIVVHSQVTAHSAAGAGVWWSGVHLQAHMPASSYPSWQVSFGGMAAFTQLDAALT